MGKRSRKPSRNSTVSRRRALIRAMLRLGTTERRIVEQFGEGFHDTKTGEIFKASKATVYRDFTAIGEAYRTAHDDPMVLERGIGTVLERLNDIAVKAAAAGNYQAAIRANLAYARLLATRSDRWGSSAAGGAAAEHAENQAEWDEQNASAEERAAIARARELAELDDQQLAARREELAERTGRLSLFVVNGGGGK
jgi:hypothetical protein